MNDYLNHPLFTRQVALEAEMVSRGADVYRKQIAEAKAENLEAATSYGSHLVRRAIKPVADAIQAFLDTANSGAAGRKHGAVKYLRDVPPGVAAFMALRTILNLISSRNTLQNASIIVGNALETEARLAHFEKANPDEYRKATKTVKHASNEQYKRVVYNYIAGKNNVELPSWPKRDKLLLGQKLIEIVVDVTGYVEIIADYRSTVAKKDRAGAYTYHVVGSKKCLDWVTKLEEYTTLATPEFLPTIIPPRPWTGPYEGGYYTIYKPLPLVKTGGANYMEELALAADDMPVLYEAVNAMQATGYTINRKTLDVMKTLWDAGGDMAGIPNRENYQLPRCPICGVEIEAGQGRSGKHPCFIGAEKEEILKTWKQEAAIVYEKNIVTVSRRFQAAKTLWLAHRFKEEKALYFPMQLDFRGRCYAVPSFLNPQGADPAKGLLQFAEGKVLDTPDAVAWLAIHGSNTWGNDKVSLEDRQAWVRAHEKMILDIAANPHDCRMWQDADKPWQFLAFCFEWAVYTDAKNVGRAHISHLPVAMDGTCNGLQIFSLMLRDPIGGTATNLLPAEKPQDIYQIVADKALEKLKVKETTGSIITRKENGEVWFDEKDIASRLLAFGISRKTTKRQVMVLPYGGTFQSCREYTLEHLSERVGNGEGSDTGINKANVFAASWFLATLIWEAIGETVVAAREAMGFLQQLASVAAAEGLPVNWTTPIGFIVSQSYYNMKEFRIKTRLGASTVRLVIREEDEEMTIDRRRQRNGISPNFVHSLDAAAMCLSISLARKEGVNSFMMVHDSYGVPAADAANMARCLRKAFVTLFTERDVLAELKEAVAAMLPDSKRATLPDIPEKGTLDIAKVLESTFFFA